MFHVKHCPETVLFSRSAGTGPQPGNPPRFKPMRIRPRVAASQGAGSEWPTTKSSMPAMSSCNRG